MIKVTNLSKSFLVGNQNVAILKDISFSIDNGDFVVIFGPSGCGKSTLLHSILGLEPPTSGKIYLFNKDLYLNTTADDRADIRKKNIGMVYQQPNWIKSLSVVANVAFPLTLLRVEKVTALQKAFEVITSLKMSDWAHYAPSELSSGQQQKIALARAVINNPELVVADEPTGNLDYQSGQVVMNFLQQLNKKHQKTIVMVTHDLEYLKYAKTVIRLFNGKIEGIYKGNKEKEKLIKKVTRGDATK